MTRIVYVQPGSNLSGGIKVAYRHVEGLRALGYDAVVRIPNDARPPAWFEHTVPIERIVDPVGPDDILVLPDDDAGVLARVAERPNRKIVFVQNPYGAASGLPRLRPQLRARYRTFLACSDGVARWVARYFDADHVSVAPGFADERLFRPAPKERVIACIPRKRPVEIRSIAQMFARLHGGAGWRWELIEGRSEAETARALGGAAVSLSLARLEGMSMTIVEAMACGCLVAGFTGIGPREYTTAENGFWAPEDDCEAAAHALVQAVAHAEAGGPEAEAMRAAGLATAARWSYAASMAALERFYRDEMGVAP